MSSVILAQRRWFLFGRRVQVTPGQRLAPGAHHRIGRLMRRAQPGRAPADPKTSIAGAVAKLPVHQAFLDGHGRAA